MLIGHRIIDNSDPHTSAQTQTPVRIPLLSDLRPSLYLPSLEQLLQRVTAQRPEQRPANAIVLGQELDDLRRSMNSDTRRLVSPPVQQPSLRERINRTATVLVAPRRQRQVPPAIDEAAILPSMQTPSEESNRNVRSRTQPFVGIAVMLLLFGVVSFGAYYVTSLVVNRLFDVHWSIPQITLPALPNLGIDLPEWLTGVPGGGGEVLIVSGAQGLNLREAPGTQSKVITALPAGTRVRKIGGPQTVGNSPWLQVRTTVDGHDVEGWLSANYLKTESGGPPTTPQN
jgi:hypothetical protein